jgi:HD-like signal output (HDOD) protein
MGKVNTADLEPGMCLADDVTASSGRFLLPRGAVLEHKHLKILQAWGITEADIEGVSSEESAARRLADLDPHILQRAKDAIDPLFACCDTENGPMKELYRLALLRTARGLVSGLDAPKRPPSAAAPDEPPSPEPQEGISPYGLLEEEVELFSLPDIFYEIVDALSSPRSSARFMAEVISKDTSLSAKLLRLVNSAFYGFQAPVSSISRAIALIGTKELMTLAQGISLVRVFQDIPEELVSMRSFWMHSVASGIYARFLSTQQIGLSEEKFFVAGLIHDLGQLVMFRKIPRLTRRITAASLQRSTPLHGAEKEALGFDHSRIGGLLCREWKLPTFLEDAVHAHHEPAKRRYALSACIIHLADVMAHALSTGCSANLYVPDLDKEAWARLGHNPSILPLVAAQADRQISEVVSIFLNGEGA